MFGKKKKKPLIDQEQLELIQHAQKRVRQKKGLYNHFIFFLIIGTCLIILNLVLGFGSDFKILNQDWFVIVLLLWLLMLFYHFIRVYVTHKFMGSEWEKKQIEKLTAKQQERINQLKEGFLKEEKLIAQSEAFNQTKESTPFIETKPKSNLTIIVAAGENNAIGKDNTLIWHLTNDLKRFKELTSGHHIIMGRKTFESFTKPLPNRTHIIITRQKDYVAPEGVIVVNSLARAIEIAKKDSQPFIIGGGEIYKEALLYATKIEMTRVHHDFEADTFFPEIDEAIWKVTNTIFHEKDKEHEYEYSFITYDKR
ncbi:MAG: Pr2TM family membrane protein [Flavobacteriaceae bacterium]|nr:Pr2TM family membrane protein [Flavobacteriaceae bacterium]